MNKLFKGVHWPMFLLPLCLSFASFFFIYSATFRTSDHLMFRQLTWLFIAVLAYWVVVAVGYRSFLNVSYTLYGVTVLVLIAVLMFGSVKQGAQRWFHIGPFVLQPSEFAKLATIMTLAHFFANHPRISGQKRHLFVSALILAIPLFLILKQPDLGTSLLLIPAFAAILLVWGLRVRYFVIIGLAFLISLPFMWHMLKPYQQRRLTVFVNPSADPLGSGYTAMQSKIAVGSGGLIGKGWLQGTQTQLDFVPEHHTDFIFCVVGEEFGFLGSLLIILLYCGIVNYAFQIMERTTDHRARLLAAGITAMLLFQLCVNIGMTIGIAPITGITLPLISYGGSSLITTFIAMGLLASIYKERSIF